MGRVARSNGRGQSQVLDLDVNLDIRRRNALRYRSGYRQHQGAPFMGRAAENKMTFVGDFHRGIDDRFVVFSQANFKRDAIVLKFLRHDRKNSSAGNLKRLRPLPRHRLAIIF